MHRVRVAVLMMVVSLGLAACGSTRHVRATPPPSGDPAAACLAQLDQRHVQYERVKDWHTAEGCGIDEAVRISASAVPWSRPALLNCEMAVTEEEWEASVVQPAARRYLGRNVVKLVHLGTYNCRAEKSEHYERLSQHSFGKAIDVSGFELDDGTRITVLRDWRGEGAKSEFLHEVAEGACGIFSVVMTPNRNALHRDHLHLDIGPHKLCGY